MPIQQAYLDDLPSDDDEHIESIPGLCEVRLLAIHAHRHELHKHLHAEESEDEVVEASEDLTACRRTHDIVAWLVHAEGDAVQDDHPHADPLKPCAARSRTTTDRVTTICIINYTISCTAHH